MLGGNHQWPDSGDSRTTVLQGLSEIMNASLKPKKLIHEGDVVFLLGAGVSVPADIPSIHKMGDEFLKRIKNNKVLEEELKKLEKLKGRKIKFNENGFDLEELMGLIEWIRIGNNIAPGYETASLDKCEKLKDHIMEVVRSSTFITNSGKAEYLKHLLDIAENIGGIDIFTTNYDTTIETLCEMGSVKYTDGFEPQWDKEYLLNSKKTIRLLKLHGSVLWYSTGRNDYRVPVMVRKKREGNVEPMFTGEKLEELILYPGYNKLEPQKIYVELHDLFMQKLKQAKLLVVLGYRFRDEEIKKTIIRAMQDNPDLWMLVATKGISDTMKHFGTSFYDAGAERILWKKIDARAYLLNQYLFEDIKTLIQFQNQWEKSKKHLVDYEPDSEQMKLISEIGWPATKWNYLTSRDYKEHFNNQYDTISKIVWMQHMKEIEFPELDYTTLTEYATLWNKCLKECKKQESQYFDKLGGAYYVWNSLFNTSMQMLGIIGTKNTDAWDNPKQVEAYNRSQLAILELKKVMQLKEDVGKINGAGEEDIIFWSYKPQFESLAWLNYTRYMEKYGVKEFTGEKNSYSKWKTLLREKMVEDAFDVFIKEIKSLN